MTYTFSNKNHRSALAIFGFQRLETIPIAESGFKRKNSIAIISDQMAFDYDCLKLKPTEFKIKEAVRFGRPLLKSKQYF